MIFRGHITKPKLQNFYNKGFVMCPRNRGQIAVGLAFVFMTFIALFALVFQSSLLTRERMKLQQTTDMATMVGANVQRNALNQIREINRDIEKAYRTTRDALRVLPCIELWSTSGGVTTLMSARANFVSGKASPTCQLACKNYDKAIRSKIIKGYEAYRNAQVGQINNILVEANGVAKDYAERSFFSASKLPFRLRHLLQKKLGKNPSSTSVRSQFTSGAIDDHIQLLSTGDLENGELPLFVPKEEKRRFTYTKSFSVEQAPHFSTCSFPSPSFPVVKQTKAKVGRHEDSYHTHFTTLAVYNAPTSAVESKFGLNTKNTTTEKREDLRDYGGKKLSLLPGHEEDDRRRLPMMVMSLAKSYGGSFPKAARGFVGRGDVGKEFKGVKLVGLADHKELEDQAPLFPLEQIFEGQLSWKEFLH